MDIDKLMEKPYWIVDILPKQVPANAEGQYFKIEQYYLKRMPHLCRKYVNILLKLNCYFDLAVSYDGENWENNPEPKKLEQSVGACISEEPTESSLFIFLKSDEVLLVIGRDSTYMTMYNPTEEILELIRQLATSEGFFVWQPNKNEFFV